MYKFMHMQQQTLGGAYSDVVADFMFW